MRSMVIRALAILQLVRMPLALAVGSDLWLATLLARWNPMAADRAASRMDLWLALAIGGLIGGGLLGFAAGMNDLLDLRRDQATNPGRPLPAGRMRTPHAALVTFGSLVTALLASVAFGDDALHVALLAAAGIVAWNTVGRHIPWLGIPMMGLAHAGVMFIPWPGQPFTLPACLVFAQAVVTGTLLHQRSGKRPAIDQRTVVGLVLIALGAGALKANASSLLGTLYAEGAGKSAGQVVGFVCGLLTILAGIGLLLLKPRRPLQPLPCPARSPIPTPPSTTQRRFARSSTPWPRWHRAWCAMRASHTGALRSTSCSTALPRTSARRQW
jgi:4-hydroxybenzoate polyprenyltransferase